MGKSKVNVTADQISSNWNKQMKASVTKMVNGVNSVTESPMEKAAAQEAAMLQNVTESITSGRWKNSLLKVDLSTWKTKTAAKIQTNLGPGVDAAMTKRQQFDRWLVENLNTILPTIAAMPGGTYDQKKQKAIAYMDAMHERKYK